MATSRTRPRASGSNGRHTADPRLDQTAPELQAFGTLRRLPIGLPDTARKASCKALNEILADTMVLQALYKKHHWLVAGPTFYQLHLLFDKHAEEQAELIDLLAERVQSLGGIAVGDPRHGRVGAEHRTHALDESRAAVMDIFGYQVGIALG